MSQQQIDILAAVRETYRLTFAPVKTVSVATRCYMSDRWARKLLAELERQGKIKRIGQRRGWEPLAA